MAMTDAEFAALRATARPYTLVLLKSGPNRNADGADQLVYQHGKRNVELRAAGKLAIVCPVRDGGELCGIGIFDADPDEVATIMDGDPGVQAGLFVYEVHPTMSFPGDALPA